MRVRVAGRDQRASLRVEDRGPGIPREERARAFDRFRRGPSGGESGAGLGLAISARIALLHGGSLALEDGPGGRGLAVSLDLPREPQR